MAATGSDSSGDGSIGNPWLTISNGVAQTTAGNVVLVSTGLYEIERTINIAKELTVRSWNAGGQEDRENTIIKSDGKYKGLYLTHAKAWVSGFTITNAGSALGGGSTMYGAGVLMNGGTLSNCILSGNTATNAHGAGVYVDGAALVTDCLVQYNRTHGTVRGDGAGIYVVSGSVRNTDVISNTAVSYSGAGISLAGSNTSVSNCVIVGNSAGNQGGGGVRIYGKNVLVVDSVISNNQTQGTGGGIGLSGSGYAIIRESTITANRAALQGCGMMFTATTPGGGALVSNCVVSYNRAVSDGATISGLGIADGYTSGNVNSGLVTVVDSQIISNGLGTGRYGGGVYIHTHGTSTFQNCEIVGNTLTSGYSYGAGMYIGTGSACVVVQNCLIAGNQMLGLSSSGGGLRVHHELGAAGGPNPLDIRVESCTIVENGAATNNNSASLYGGLNVRADGMQVWNTVVVSNRAGKNYPDMQGDAAYIAPVYYSCSPVLTNAENGNITGAPVFAEEAAGKYRLQRTSPGVNAGSNSAWMEHAVDLDGRRRIDLLSGRVDMGAYECLFPGSLIRLR